MKYPEYHQTRQEDFIDALSKPLSHMMTTAMEAAAARVLDLYLKTKGDAISQSQAEREFGKKWIADHIKVYGPAIFTVGVWNRETGAANQKKTFSRKQLAEIRLKETTFEGLRHFADEVYAYDIKYVQPKKKRKNAKKEL